jgi:hypothetical protein
MLHSLIGALYFISGFGKLAESWDANAGLRASCPNLQSKNDGPKVRTRFPRSDSLQESRSLFKRKEGIQISLCCPAAVAPGAVSAPWFLVCPSSGDIGLEKQDEV